MTLNELKGKYARLSNEIDALAANGGGHEARMLRLMNDLDQVHHELAELRRRTWTAPTLRDAVSRPEPAAVKPPVAQPAVQPAVQPQPQPMAVPMGFSPALSAA
jgi:hypothetical protein